jgi:hypothetical protein
LYPNPQPRVDNRELILIALGDRICDVLNQANHRWRGFEFAGQATICLAQLVGDDRRVPEIEPCGGHLAVLYARLTPESSVRPAGSSVE